MKNKKRNFEKETKNEKKNRDKKQPEVKKLKRKNFILHGQQAKKRKSRGHRSNLKEKKLLLILTLIEGNIELRQGQDFIIYLNEHWHSIKKDESQQNESFKFS